MKIAVYTAIFGNYDQLVSPKNYNKEENIDYFCFTDSGNETLGVYEIIRVDPPYKNNTLNNRYYKIIIPVQLKDYDYTIYHDANIYIDHNKIPELASTCKEGVLTVFTHSHRNNVYDECLACIYMGKDTSLKVFFIAMINFLLGVNKSIGLYENSIIVRNNQNLNYQKFSKFWWFFVRNVCQRDQLSIGLVNKLLKQSIDIIPGKRTQNEYSSFGNYHTKLTSMQKSVFNNFSIISIRVIKKILKV